MSDPLAGARRALLVATSVYHDSTLPRLRTPTQAAAAMAQVLGDPDMGRFEVSTVSNGTTYDVKLAIETFLEACSPDDMTLLFLCGHGVRDQPGLLYLAATDTDRAHPASTSVEASWLRTQLDGCRARQQLLILDCCSSGAFGLSSDDELREQFTVRKGGLDRVVLASSNSVQPSFELVGQSVSLFTAGLLDGITTGQADRDKSGYISVGEAFDHAAEYVKKWQTPRHWVYGGGTKIVLARIDGSTPRLPDDLIRGLVSSFPGVRQAVIDELVTMLHSDDPGQRELARRELRKAADGDIPDVASAARRALSPPAPPKPAPPARLPSQTYPFPEWIRCVQFRPDDDQLAVAGQDRTVLVVDRRRGQVTHTLLGHTDWVRAVAFHRDGRTLASAGDDTRVLLWDLGSDSARVLSDHRNAVLSLAFSPDGRFLASAGRDIAIRMWDVASGEVRHRMTDHRGTFTCVAFRPDGLMLASASDDGLVRLWNPFTGQLLRSLSGHSGRLNAVAFNPEGTLLASAGEDRIVRLWEVNAEGTDPVREIRGHTAPVLALSIGRAVIASGAEDGAIQLDAVRGTAQVDRLTAHRGSVDSLVVSHNGKLLASAGKDTTVRIWRL